MPSIVIRLHPDKPVAPATFTSYLQGLQIQAYDLSFGSPKDGTPVGPLATFYPAVVNPPSPSDGPPDVSPHQAATTGIVQHFEAQIIFNPGPVSIWVPLSIATAVINVPVAGYENLRLDVTRAGAPVDPGGEFYNVAVEAGTFPADQFQNLTTTTSLYLSLPAPVTDPNAVYLTVPTDGSPPSFDQLLVAAQGVLAVDPGGAAQDLGALSPEQCKNIAYEIVWSSQPPLPTSPNSLRELYDDPPNTGAADDTNEQHRKQFEGALTSYYATPNATADRLAKWVFALAAAFACEKRTAQAAEALLTFPVNPGPAAGTALLPEADVILTAPVAGNPMPINYGVPAAYFYALGASMPPQVTADQRYRMARGDTAERLFGELAAAVEAGLIGDSYHVTPASPPVNPAQAVRQLLTLVITVPSGIPRCQIAGTLPALMNDWLAYPPAAQWKSYLSQDDNAAFWPAEAVAQPAAFLNLVLCALTQGYVLPAGATPAPPAGATTLSEQIRPWLAGLAPGPPTVATLAGVTEQQWTAFFQPTDGYLPPFTKPGNKAAQIAAFIRHVQKFFEVAPPAPPAAVAAPAPGEPSVLPLPSGDVLQACLSAYDGITGGPAIVLGSNAGLNASTLRQAAALVFTSDPAAQTWAIQALLTLDQLWNLASGVAASAPQAFSVVEALYARGLTTLADIQALTPTDLGHTLIGTVAYDQAAAISAAAAGNPIPPSAPQGPFQAINPDGSLSNCIPVPCRSPLGPIEYLHEMLRLSELATCEAPFTPASRGGPDLGDVVALRRGPIAAALLASCANLETPIPRIDIVNECLENVAANPALPVGVVYDTAADELAGHELCSAELDCSCSPEDDWPGCHDPARLFATMPQHSSPATPVAQPGGYASLRDDFSTPALPYSQPLDVSRSYLGALGSTRLAAMRTFREHITEFALDPSVPPPGFQSHLWRYPLRLELVVEQLGLTPEEFDILFDQPGHVPTWQLFGFATQAVGGSDWTEILAKPLEFLTRTGLSYCELVELQRSMLVPFTCTGADDGHLPDCESCCLDDLVLDFGADPAAALQLLVAFIRLQRALRHACNGGYTFERLADVYEILGAISGGLNGEFIRQMGAFETLRCDFLLPFSDERDQQPGTAGANRTHLLALWVGPGAGKWAWAETQLLKHIHDYGCEHHGGHRRPPRFVKLLRENLDPLSRLAGFDPETAADTWWARPTHTVRYAEVLAKIYASRFGVGEILYLFTSDSHLDGDDPFPLQEPNESLDQPFGLPDDEREHSLWRLRECLLHVQIPDEECEEWTWVRITRSLREEFGYTAPAAGPDALTSLGEHYFPSVLESEGIQVAAAARRYQVALAGSTPQLWDAPLGGPFHYDDVANELSAHVPLADEDVVAKLGRTRQLNPAEAQAAQNLYFLPRVDLAPFAFLFPDLPAADRHLIQERDEGKRWNYFRRHFAEARTRCRLIAEHLSEHVGDDPGCEPEDGAEVTWRILRDLFADQNSSLTPWESDAGAVPEVAWKPPPSGGAFASLLGLTGTGLLGEFANLGHGQPPVWRYVGGSSDSFGRARNSRNAPVPTLIPAMDLALSPANMRFATSQNGYAVRDRDGQQLGGAQGFAVRWSGVLLVECEGRYDFLAGAPTPDDEEPDFEAAEHNLWRVKLRRGQKTWIVLNHRWPDEQEGGPSNLHLERGAYEIEIEFTQPQPEFTAELDVRRQRTGFQLKYRGPDSDERLIEIPDRNLFRSVVADTLAAGIAFPAGSQAKTFLDSWFTSSLRDFRRTYQRAFKAVLFAKRFGLSARRIADDHQSEIAYLLANADRFAGVSHYPTLGGFVRHAADFDFNLLPLLDHYATPTAALDDRVAPSLERRQALFDSWERIFDYVRMRDAVASHRTRPAWLLFHEAQESQPPDPSALVRHLGIDLRYAGLLLHVYDPLAPGIRAIQSSDLEDDRWAVRVWHGAAWIQHMRRNFLPADITAARPCDWVADDPSAIVAGEAESGNANLSAFLANGLLENGRPQRYEELEEINDGLRVRARDALTAFLCTHDRVALPWGGSAQRPGDLSALFLIDVEVGVCERASRIEDAVSAAQTLVQRARLGLEPQWVVTYQFARMWDRRFATFRTWEACRRRELYKENWIEWEELERADRIEGFQFLESELRQSALSVALPGGLEWWPDERPPDHPSLEALQSRVPSQLHRLVPPREGLELLGSPERDARPSWLAPLPGDSDREDPRPDDVEAVVLPQPGNDETFPYWMQAAMGLGTRFYRVAAAGEPEACMPFRPHPRTETACCAECGETHPEHVDEYFFWLVDAQQFSESDLPQAQQANPEPYKNGYQPAYYDQTTHESGLWHDPDQLPQLLAWPTIPAVRLAWCRVHNGEFQQPRRSEDEVKVTPGQPADLTFSGRSADSLIFEVTNAAAPPSGYTDPSPPGFRYDLPTDWAIALPLVAPSTNPAPTYLGVLPTYPYFVYHAPGARLFPGTSYGPAVAVACTLRAHCRFEAALKWYQRAFDPLRHNCTWVHCEGHDEQLPPDDGGDGPVPLEARRRGEDGPSNCCDSTDISDDQARDRSILLLQLETMLQWGDALHALEAPEAFAQARLIYDTAAMILGPRPRSVVGADSAAPATVGAFVPDWPPLNPRLLDLYDLVADRLGLIQACLDAKRLRNGRGHCELAYFGETHPLPGAHSVFEGCTHLDPCPDGAWCLPHSPYRFLFLVEKAMELAAQVRDLGAEMLAAFEKGDAEYLASVRANQDRELQALALAVRQDAWRDADWQVQALQRTKAATQTNLLYYNGLIQGGLLNHELQYEDLTNTAMVTRAAGNIVQAIGEVMKIIPDMFVGFPCEEVQLPIGTKLAGVFESAGRIIDTIADVESTTASLDLTEAGWDRRLAEWINQSQVLTIDVEQVERQILGAQRRRDQAVRELNIQRRQIEHSADVQDFLRDKLTGHTLYLHLQKETGALHHRMYELAVHLAAEAERAFNIECGHTTRRFLPRDGWDDLHEGLLAGERLHTALQHMEKAYLAANTREYELTKHISLRMDFPAAYLELRNRGHCEVCIPEWMFDLDYPGMYMRRIRNVSLTIPCVTGPYKGVHCRLTLLSSETRVDPRLAPPSHRCCHDRHHGDGYELCADDPRAVRQYGALEAIATSSGQSDSGMFEVNFRDERYLPFEYAGGVSRWRLELPQENNQFDLDTLSDVTMHLSFTAREGGELLRRAANSVAQRHLPGAGVRLFDVRHELPEAWAKLQDDSEEKHGHRELAVSLSRGMFPFLPGRRSVSVHRLDLFFEAPNAEPSASRRVEFLVGHRPGHAGDEDCDCPRYSVACVVGAEWPTLFHGVLEVHDPIQVNDEKRMVGSFRLPRHIGRVSRAFLLCGYSAITENRWSDHGASAGSRQPSISRP